MPSKHNFPTHPGPRIIIIGAGVGGLSCAIALKRQLGFQNFMIFEKAYSVGGTWRDNIYPGCSSDVPAHFYSLSTDLKSDWSCSHPFQPEIEAYWVQLSKKYSLYPHIIFGCKVIKAIWDPVMHLYHITTEDVETGEKVTTDAEILISALGFLEVPRFPNIPGLAEFQGHAFHSARWADIELSGKRVAVIGNGASATQLLPVISKESKIQVTQFCRTPNWILPPIRKWYSPWHIWAFKYLPLYQRTLRFLQYLWTDISYISIFRYSITRHLIGNLLKFYIQKGAPAKYQQNLIPHYDVGCKRIIFDTDYLSALHQDNVRLNYDGIASVDQDGINTKLGEHMSFDVIILATGFAADTYPLVVQGLEGRSIQEYNDSKGGPTAYLGTAVPGFPNFYVLAGPNTATGHTSVILFEEIQINYIIELIKPILKGRLSAIDVTTKATDEYNTKLQARLSRSVFVQCNSWYRVDGSGKVNSMFPGSAALFWWWLRRPVWNHYNVIKRDEQGWTRAWNKSVSNLGICLTLVAATSAWVFWPL